MTRGWLGDTQLLGMSRPYHYYLPITSSEVLGLKLSKWGILAIAVEEMTEMKEEIDVLMHRI